MTRAKKIILIGFFLELIAFGALAYEVSVYQKYENKGRLDVSSNYILYTKEGKISFKDLIGSIVLYKNVTMKLQKDKLKIIASFGEELLNKKQREHLLKIIKKIDKAREVRDIKVGKEEKILISGKNFYIEIYPENRCIFYKIMNNDKTFLKALKYCKGEINGK